MKNIRIFLSENLHFLVVNFLVYLNRHVFVMLLVNIAIIIDFVLSSVVPGNI